MPVFAPCSNWAVCYICSTIYVMETINIDKDIRVFYVTAASFPAGIADAHKRLHSLVPFSPARRYFGISRPENGAIVYRAAAEEMAAGEAAQYGCETLVLKKGSYIATTIEDYTTDNQSISKAFKELLAYPGIDPAGYCVEWYLTEKKVVCAVRLA